MAAIDNMMKSLLEKVAEGEGLVFETLVSKYLGGETKSEATVESKPKCSAFTAKGKPCSIKPLDGKCVCRIHDKASSPKPVVSKPVSVPKAPVKKPKKVKKTQPEHNHELDDGAHSDCELCQSHGSPLAETDDEEEFEVVKSPAKNLAERMAKLASYDEEEED